MIFHKVPGFLFPTALAEKTLTFWTHSASWAIKRKGGGNQIPHNRAQTTLIIYNHIDMHGRMAPFLQELDTEDVSCNIISGRKCPYKHDIYISHAQNENQN